jgi:hypothetical protein
VSFNSGVLAMKNLFASTRLRGLALGAVTVAALVPLMAPKPALAWWRGGGFGVSIGLPAVVVPPPVVYAPPPAYYAPPPVAYAPARQPVWVPPYWTGTYWVPGHWA